MKRGRDVMARKKSIQRTLSRAAYFTLRAVPFDAMFKAEMHAYNNRLENFEAKTFKIIWPKEDMGL